MKYLCNARIEFMDGQIGNVGDTVDLDPTKVTDLDDVLKVVIAGQPALVPVEAMENAAKGLAAGTKAAKKIVDAANQLGEAAKKASEREADDTSTAYRDHRDSEVDNDG